jgi:hypothetical protein
MEDVLEIQGGEVDVAAEHCPYEQHDDRGGAPGSVGEEVQREHRGADAALATTSGSVTGRGDPGERNPGPRPA